MGSVTAQPWVSVIVPAYNGAKYIAQALRSVESQASDDVEVIVIDDGSTDETTAIVDSFSRRLDVRLHRLDHSGNWVLGTNVGLTLARGVFACFLHQDDLWLPPRLRELKRLTAAFGESTLVLAPSLFVDAWGRHLGTWNCPLVEGPLNAADLIEALLVQNFVAIPAPIFSLSLARKAGGLDETLWYTADWDFWLKMCQLSSRVIYCTQPLSAFRVHAASQTVVRAKAAAPMREQQEIVVSRHHELVVEGKRASVERLARASIAVNHALAMSSAGNPRGWPEALVSLATLGPTGILQYLTQSRALERVSARLRARLRRSP
jgi:hypothetical protein